MRTYRVKAAPTTTGETCFVAWYTDLPECLVQGSTPEEALQTLFMVEPQFAAALAEPLAHRPVAVTCAERSNLVEFFGAPRNTPRGVTA